MGNGDRNSADFDASTISSKVSADFILWECFSDDFIIGLNSESVSQLYHRPSHAVHQVKEHREIRDSRPLV